MKKYRIALVLLLCTGLLPTRALASSENPVKKIGGYMKWDWKWLDGLEWIFSPVMLVLSIVLILGFVFLVGRIILKIAKIRKGQSILKDKEFWVETGVVLILMFLLFSGSLFTILGNIYDWTNKQDIGAAASVAASLERSLREITF